MSDTPLRFHPSGDHKLKPNSRRQYRLSDDHSPTRGRIQDELLSQLTPMSAVDVLQHPTPALKTCLDAATANEQGFAMRTALASQSIYEWLDELSEWPWPSTGGSAGFEPPAPKRRKLFAPAPAASDDDLSTRYTGSLPTEDISRYQDRIGEISRGLEDLDIDDIKNHVLHNHILPLSRPGTPLLDSRRGSIALTNTFNTLDDLAACVTAIIMQALPNLSRLNRLLRVWEARLLVLEKVPSVLAGIEDAELALQSGWNVVSQAQEAPGNNNADSRSRGLTQKDFDVMKLILQKKVARPGHNVDFMLDTLEGMEDTLPESWIERMDAVEEDYAAWHVACERKIRGATLAPSRPQRPPTDTAPTASETSVETGSPAQTGSPTNKGEDRRRGRAPAAVNIQIDPPKDHAASLAPSADAESSQQGAPQETSIPKTPARSTRLSTIGLTEMLSPPSTAEPLSHRSDLQTPASLHHRQFSSYDGPDDVDPVKSDFPTPFSVVGTSEVPQTPSGRRVVSENMDDDTVIVGHENDSAHESTLQQFDDSDSDVPHTPEGEPELPPLIPQGGHCSNASPSSTVIHERSSPVLTSDLPEVSASPPLPRERFSHPPNKQLLDSPMLDSVEAPAPAIRPDLQMGGDPVVDAPSSSPPFTHSFREDSLGPWDGQEDESMFRSSVNSAHSIPFSSSFVEEDTENTSTLPNIEEASEIGQDEQLHQQIHEILESIPAKIKLANSPRKVVNLNPPPLELPTLPTQRGKKPGKEPIRRSASGLSSRASTRASTPSWLLAPARAHRQRGQQETRVYHFSRSTGEAPIKLLIRCVGENGERVMVRVGGGWADLGEYLKDYALRHGRRTQNADTSKIEIQDLPRVSNSRAATASPDLRPVSALEHSPMTPLQIRKTRRSFGASAAPERPRPGPSRPKPVAFPHTPGDAQDDKDNDTPPSDSSARSRSSSRLSWTEEDSFLGLAGPTGRKVEMSEESRAWVESVKEKVRLASGERKPPAPEEGRFGELGKVGGTKRLFRKG